MQRLRPLLLPLAAAALLLGVAGCNTAKPPTTATALDPEIRKKVEKGIVEPGFTPEMVYMALGKPSVPADGLADSTRDGTWIYNDFRGNDRDFIRSGFRRRVVFDPVRKSDVVVTEPVDARLFPHLRAHSLQITFRDGRVTEITRVEMP
ncbi:MAG: hypothetical protein V4773_13345 [Verrucomicrobiota bacterium]